MSPTTPPNIEPIRLPSNWHDLRNDEKFVALRNLPELVRGRELQNIEIDCGAGTMTDRDANFVPQVNRPGREIGSFTFKAPRGNLVTGRLEILSAGDRLYDRIFVLGRANTSDEGKRVPRVLSEQELAHIASLLEVYENACGMPQPQHIDVYVIPAELER